MMSIEIVHELSENEWRCFVESHPAGNIFHTPEMFQVFSHTKGYRPELWAAIKSERILALLLPVQITLKDGLLRPLSTRAVAYGSVLSVPTNEGRDALAVLLRSYTHEVKGSPLFTKLRNISDLSDTQPVLNECGFSFQQYANYLIDLEQSEETVWRRLSKKTRQHVQRARDSCLIIEEMTEASKLAVAYQLLRQVYARVHVPLASITMFQAALDILVAQNMLKIVTARVGERYIGVNFVLTFKGQVIDWYRGSDRGFSSYYPEPMMIWHLLQWSIQHGFRCFDFGGAGRPEEDYGPRIFKSRWGGALVNYGRNTYVHAPIRLKLSGVGYKITRKSIMNIMSE